jgi:redox-sensitive bicupin YhaK (pirin superfamily)
MPVNLKLVKNLKELEFQWETLDPFLFCFHHEDEYPSGTERMGINPKELVGRSVGQDFISKDGWRMYHGKKIPGFPNHPHRGFETVTVVRKGFVDHTDSMGAAGRYSSGDTQWMTAGEGVQHCEMFPLIHQTQKNPTELFQIWLNLPSVHKLVKPHFTMLWKESIPIFEHSDSSGAKTEIELVAGSLGGLSALPSPPNSWAADPQNMVAIWVAKMEPFAKWTLPPAGPGINRMIYFFGGSTLQIADTEMSVRTSAELESDSEIEIQNGETEGHFLFLQGKPIAEPIAQYGPFVMNTTKEIQESFYEFQKTQFGGWHYSSHEPVHPRSKGRFAKHSDGKEEHPPKPL